MERDHRLTGNRAYAALEACQKLERQVRSLEREISLEAYKKLKKIQSQLEAGRLEAKARVQLADDLTLLGKWMKQDVLALAGSDLPTREALFDFVVQELKSRQHLCPDRLIRLGRGMVLQRRQLLSFVGYLDSQWEQIAQDQQVPAYLVSEVLRPGGA